MEDFNPTSAFALVFLITIQSCGTPHGTSRLSFWAWSVFGWALRTLLELSRPQTKKKSGLQERAWSIISAKVHVFRSYSGTGLPSSGSMLKLRLLVSRNNSSLHPKKRQNSQRHKRKSTSKWWASSNLRSSLAIWKEARSTKYWFLTSRHLEDRLDTTKR